MEYEQLIVFVMYHTAVGRLLAWEREPKNTVGMYCGRRFIRHRIESFIIRLTQANVCESIGKPCSCMQFSKSRIFFTASHVQIRIRYCKSRALHLNVQWNWRFVWLNHYHHSTKIYRKKITRLLPLALLLVLYTHNNTDGNKLVIFSGTIVIMI